MPGRLRLLAAPLLVVSTSVFAATPVPIPDGPHAAAPGDPLNQDRAKFNVSTFDDGTGRAFYFSSQNNRILVNYQNPNGTWRYNPSRVAIEFPDSPTTPITIALGVVLAATTSDYKNPLDGAFYKRLMYFIYQGPTSGAGAVCAAFSNDGLAWTTAVRVGLTAAPAVACDSPSGTPTKLESIAGARSGATLWLAGLEGDIGVLTTFAGTPRTLTYLFSASPLTPHVLTKQGELPTAGMSTPTGIGGANDYYFRNLDFTYDPVTDKALILRVTPYGYYLTDQRPCMGVCPGFVATFPMRGQVYSQRVNGNPLALLTGTWTREADLGRGVGWPRLLPNQTCSPPIGIDNFTQSDIGLDLDSINLHKQMNGFVARAPSGFVTYYMGAFLDRLGSCRSHSTAQDTFLDAALYSLDQPL